MPFKPGESGNPSGRAKSVFQGIATRIRYYIEEFSVEEILALASDAKRIKELPVVDYQAVKRIQESFKAGGLGAMDRLWDRAYGKAPEHVQLTGKDGASLDFDGRITIEHVPAKPSNEEFPALPPPSDAIEHSDS